MFILKSSAFENGGIIPDRYAEGDYISPELHWENIPDGTKSFALDMIDPDVPDVFNFPRVFAHWMMYNIPASTTSIPEGASPGKQLPSGAVEMNTDFVTFQIPGFSTGYGPPWPPDASHRYVFNLYALKVSQLDIPIEADYPEFAKTVLPQTIASAVLIGNYGPAKTPLPGS